MNARLHTRWHLISLLAATGCSGAAGRPTLEEMATAERAAYKRGYLDGRAWEEAAGRPLVKVKDSEIAELRVQAAEAERRASVQGAAAIQLQSCEVELDQTQRRMIALETVAAKLQRSGDSTSGSDSSPARQRTATQKARCDPNYSPCVPIDSDVDCAGGSGNGPSYVSGPVRVIGADIYGLDRDGDGIGCD